MMKWVCWLWFAHLLTSLIQMVAFCPGFLDKILRTYEAIPNSCYIYMCESRLIQRLAKTCQWEQWTSESVNHTSILSNMSVLLTSDSDVIMGWTHTFQSIYEWGSRFITVPSTYRNLRGLNPIRHWWDITEIALLLIWINDLNTSRKILYSE